MPLEDHIHRTNRTMIAFDLALGAGTLLAPAAMLRVLGHDAPSPDAEKLFQRCGPIWLTFAAAPLVAARRGRARGWGGARLLRGAAGGARPEDWWALAWLRGTEWLTDVVWSSSPAISRPGAKAALRGAGLANLAMSLGFARLSSRSWRRGR